jgi:hypothetical protein
LGNGNKEARRRGGGAGLEKAGRAACPMPRACALWLKMSAPKRIRDAQCSKWDASIPLLRVTLLRGHGVRRTVGRQLRVFSRGARGALLAALAAPSSSASLRERRLGGGRRTGQLVPTGSRYPKQPSRGLAPAPRPAFYIASPVLQGGSRETFPYQRALLPWGVRGGWPHCCDCIPPAMNFLRATATSGGRPRAARPATDLGAR